MIQVCIWDEFKNVIEQSDLTLMNNKGSKTNYKELRFCTLAYLTQAFVNIIILSQDQEEMIKKVKRSGTIQKLLNILNIVASNQLL